MFPREDVTFVSVVDSAAHPKNIYYEGVNRHFKAKIANLPFAGGSLFADCGRNTFCGRQCAARYTLPVITGRDHGYCVPSTREHGLRTRAVFRDAVWVVDSGGSKEACITWGHIGATWRIRMNRPCAAAMRPYVKLL